MPEHDKKWPLKRRFLHRHDRRLASNDGGEVAGAARQHALEEEARGGELGLVEGRDVDRKSVVSGKSVSVRVALGGRGTIQTRTTDEVGKHMIVILTL